MPLYSATRPNIVLVWDGGSRYHALLRRRDADINVVSSTLHTIFAQGVQRILMAGGGKQPGDPPGTSSLAAGHSPLELDLDSKSRQSPHDVNAGGASSRKGPLERPPNQCTRSAYGDTHADKVDSKAELEEAASIIAVRQARLALGFKAATGA
eukprot:4470364-Pleurochrysis_carterae.AAC.1